MVWEIWRKNRIGFGISLGALMVSPLLSYGLVLPLAVISFVSLFAIFSCVDSSGQLSFPERTFTLPIPTSRLVHGPILSGVVAITVLHTLWSRLVWAPRAVDLPSGFFVPFWAGAMVAFQALVWSLGRFPKSLAVALFLAAAAFGRLAFEAVEGNGRFATATAVVILAVAYAAAYVTLKFQRSGRWMDWSRVRQLVESLVARWADKRWPVGSGAAVPAASAGVSPAMDSGARRPSGRRDACPTTTQFMERVLAAVPGKSRPFGSRSQAQFWMEWRQNGVVPTFWLALLVALLTGIPLMKFVGEDDAIGITTSIGPAWLFLATVFLALWGAIAGLNSARDPASKKLVLSPFSASRPVSTEELAMAKIRLAGALTLIAWLAGLIMVASWIVTDRGMRIFLVRENGAELSPLVVLALVMFWNIVGALPLWLAGRIESVVWAGLLLLLGYVAGADLLRRLDEHFLLPAALPWIFTVALALKIALAVWAFYESSRRGLLRGQTALRYSVFWLAGTSGFITVAVRLGPVIGLPDHLVVLGAALLFPLARVGLAPLALARARHR